MKNVLIMFGGVSTEHDVSLMSATSVIRNVPKDKYKLFLLGITKDGEMYLYEGDSEKLENDGWLEDKSVLKKAVISTNRSDRGIIVFENGGYRLIKIDVCFPVLHGKNGEDGTVQGLLTIAGIPFVGCAATASAVCMDKAVCNSICDANGILQAKWKYITKYSFEREGRAFAAECADYMSFPMFVKPANAGSSVGVRKVNNEDELYSALGFALTFDDRAVVEEGIDGVEVECAVLGNDEPIAGSVGEIEPCNEFYDYDAKYIANKSGLHIPARLPEEKIEEIRALAVKIFKACGCAGLARIDFFVRHSDGAVLLNEPNTLPGFTSISMYSVLMDKVGVPYGELIDRLLLLAEENFKKI